MLRPKRHKVQVQPWCILIKKSCNRKCAIQFIKITRCSQNLKKFLSRCQGPFFAYGPGRPAHCDPLNSKLFAPGPHVGGYQPMRSSQYVLLIEPLKKHLAVVFFIWHLWWFFIITSRVASLPITTHFW